MAAASSTGRNRPYVEVNVWFARNDKGEVTTSSEGVRQHGELARCGHASIQMYNGQQNVYASLWPSKSFRGSPGVIIDSLEQDQKLEGSKPDVIMRLFALNVNKMIQAFNAIEQRVDTNQIAWDMPVSIKEDITNPAQRRASCTTLVYSLLKVGGFSDKTSQYYQHIRRNGPKDKSFYTTTRCDLVMRAGGFGDKGFWTEKVFTPKGLVLRVASAAEAYFEDKQATSEIMGSDRVEQNFSQTVKHKEQVKKKVKVAAKVAKKVFLKVGCAIQSAIPEEGAEVASAKDAEDAMIIIRQNKVAQIQVIEQTMHGVDGGYNSDEVSDEEAAGYNQLALAIIMGLAWLGTCAAHSYYSKK